MRQYFPAFSGSMLATACLSIMISNAQAASPNPDAALYQDQSQPSVPSAIDSSRRVIRPAKSAATLATQAKLSSGQYVTASELPEASPQRLPAAIQRADRQDPETIVHRYQQPDTSDLLDSGVDLSQAQLSHIPVPTASVTDIEFIDTIRIPQTQDDFSSQIDVSLVDAFIEDVSPNARHYPPNFPNRSQRYNTREKIKVWSQWIEPYANAPNASYEVLLRAAKLNGMGRNLDLGSDYAVRASNYIARAIERQPESAEANFLYGMMLTEGGGFKEGKKYLNKAAALGYIEAEQSLAQSDLLSDRRGAALDRLRQLQLEYPNNDIINQQIQIIEEGKYYIWDLPAPDVNVKPVS